MEAAGSYEMLETSADYAEWDYLHNMMLLQVKLSLGLIN
jgi:hypothetical protein